VAGTAEFGVPSMTDRASAASPQGPAVVDPLIGRVISDRFRITGVLARGGMGKIYRAEQAPLGRICALKVLSPSSAAGEHDGEFHKRFFLEASIASKLTHPNTVTIFDYGRTEDDIYYMAMEYLDGSTLQRAIRAAGFFAEDRAAHIARQICRALREAHSLGVIHRDLKPANVFLVEHGDEADFVKVLDFGLVKNVAEASGEELTRVGVFVGSPKYMAPEQIRGDRVDARTDIYALGTVLYEMLAGKVPFARASTVHIMVAQVNEPPPPLRQTNPDVQVSPALEETIMRCLAKDPDERFRSMDELLGCLRRIGGGPLLSGSGAGESRVAQQGPNFETHPFPDGTGSGPTGGFAPSGSRPSTLLPPLSAPSVAVADSAPISIPISEEPVRARSNGRGAATVLGALGIAAAFGVFFAMRPSKSPAAAPLAAEPAESTVPSGVAASVVPASAAVTSTSAATLMATVSVRINSDPDEADVRENGIEICASTPCDVAYEGAEGDPARIHRLTVSRSGYRTEVRTIKVGDSPVIVRMTKVDPSRLP
jgi:serine/threonine protein kinase